MDDAESESVCFLIGRYVQNDSSLQSVVYRAEWGLSWFLLRDCNRFCFTPVATRCFSHRDNSVYRRHQNTAVKHVTFYAF